MGKTMVATALLLGMTVSARGQALPAEPPQFPAVGEVIPVFSAQAVDGAVQDVSFPKGSSTVLVFFLSGCPTCHKMIPEWNRAFARKPAKLRMIGVLMDQEPPGFFQSMPISFPVVRSPGREFLQSLKVHRAPLTLRVGEGGKIQDAALGLLDPIRLGEFFRP